MLPFLHCCFSNNQNEMLFQSLSSSFSTLCEYSAVDLSLSHCHYHISFIYSSQKGICNFSSAICSFHGNMHKAWILPQSEFRKWENRHFVPLQWNNCQKCIPLQNDWNDNHLFFCFSLSHFWCCSWFLLSSNPDRRGNQAALSPLVQKKGRRRNLAAGGVGEQKRLRTFFLLSLFLLTDKLHNGCIQFLFGELSDAPLISREANESLEVGGKQMSEDGTFAGSNRSGPPKPNAVKSPNLRDVLCRHDIFVSINRFGSSSPTHREKKKKSAKKHKRDRWAGEGQQNVGKVAEEWREESVRVAVWLGAGFSGDSVH